MRNNLYFILVVLCLIGSGCFNKKNTQVQGKDNSYKQVKNNSVAKTNGSLSVKKTEYLDWYTIKINNKAHSVTTKKILYNLLGKPDSIITPDPFGECGASYFAKDYKYVYIKGCEFELHGDSLAISSLNFKDNGVKLVFKNLILDSNTTLVSLANIFPIAVKKKYEVQSDHNEKKMAIILGDGANYVEEDDEFWILLFSKGKLIEIDYHIDC